MELYLRTDGSINTAHKEVMSRLLHYCQQINASDPDGMEISGGRKNRPRCTHSRIPPAISPVQGTVLIDSVIAVYIARVSLIPRREHRLFTPVLLNKIIKNSFFDSA
jgi:hypothetical protein